MRTFSTSLLAFACALVFYSASVLAGSNTSPFQAFSDAFYDEQSRQLTHGLERIASYDHLPAPDGVFTRFVRDLRILPPRKDQLPLVIGLLQKSDPYLQEAGVLLATSSVAALNDYSGLANPLCALLAKPDLDPWVFKAIIEFAAAANHPRSPPLARFYEAFATVAYAPHIDPVRPLGINRVEAIHPYEDAIGLLDQVMANSNIPTERSKAILPFLERAHATKGWAQTYDTVITKISGRRYKQHAADYE